MSLSVSILSEASKDEIETDDKELQELVWSLMSRSGLLSEMQGRIAKFLEDHGKDDKIHVIPGRADARLLGLIFEYLQWVGMKQTNSILLSESPVAVDLSAYESRSKAEDYKPKLCRLLEEGNDETEGEDGMSASKSHNYSKDEFDDSKLTSCSPRPPAKVNDEEEVEDLASDNEDEENEESSLKKSQKSSKEASTSLPNETEKKDALHENTNGTEKPLETPIFSAVTTDLDLTDGRNRLDDMLIDLNSPLKPLGVDQARPHVTVRQRVDLSETSADPFQSPRTSRMDTNPNLSLPVVASNNRLDFTGESNPVEGIEDNDEVSSIKDGNKIDGDGDNNFFQVIDETTKGPKKPSNPDRGLLKPEQTKTNPVKEVPRQESPEDDSTSDFMETLTMEEDTQDVSIPSDTQGMSSCEHAVNLK